MKNYYLLFILLLTLTLAGSTVKAQVNISNATTAVCTDSLYDSGGQSGSYANDENFEYVISPTGAVTVSINIDSINIAAGDTLRIHDGTDTTASVLYIFTDTSAFIPGTITSSGGNITVHFKSDGANTDFGFKMHWSANLNSASVAVSKSVTNICAGDNVTFTATPTNGGGAPDYQWYVNGSMVGTNSTTYADNGLVNNDYVWVELDADGGLCQIDSIAYDSLQVTVTTKVTASVAVTADSSVCDGTNVLFTATPTNGGTPAYDWTINAGGSVGTASAYSNSSLNDNDVVRVEMTSSIGTGCLIDSVSYAIVNMNINPNPSVTIGAPTHNLCNGDTLGAATAGGSGGTGTLVYSWNDGNSQTTATAVNLAAGNYTVTVTDDSLCIDTDNTTINEPTALSNSFSVTNVSTFGNNDGQIVATPSGGSPTYSHKWNTTPVQTTATATGLVAGWYTDTLTDNNGCVNIDSAEVTQPTILLGGQIRKNGSTSDEICAGEIVGNMTNQITASGGIGAKTYTWQYSTNLLTWADYPSSNSSAYNLNDSITQITFVRRRVYDAAATPDTAYSNTLFLNYIADQFINIIGLDTTYCQGDSVVNVVGTPNTPGTGSFTSTAYMTSGGVFTPSLASSSPGGTTNNVVYSYTDQYGCFSSKLATTKVFDTSSASVSISQTQFAPNSFPVVFISTYPGSWPNGQGGGTFSGSGVYFSQDTFRFDPSLVDTTQYDVPLTITFNYTNPNGCTSTEYLTVIVANTQVLLGIASNSTNFSTCANNGSDTIFADLPVGDTVIQHVFFVYNSNYSRVIYSDPCCLYDQDTLTDFVYFPFDPANFQPGTLPNSPDPTSVGVQTLHVRFWRRTIANPSWTFVETDMELVNLGNVTLTSTETNDNGTPPSFYYLHCEDKTSKPISTTYFNLGARPANWNLSVNSGSPGVLTDNGDGTGSLHPDQATIFYDIYTPSFLRDTVRFVYTDVTTSCSVSAEKLFYVPKLPPVNLLGLNSQYCSNDGLVEVWGTPWSTNRGTFTASDITGLNFSTVSTDDTASFIAGPNAVGSQWIEYKYLDGLGCVDSIEIPFTVDTIPMLDISSIGGYEFCLDDDSTFIGGRVWNGTSFVANQGDSITGPGIYYRNNIQGTAYFFPDSAGPGSHTIRFHHTDAGGTNCYNFYDTTIVVNALPDPSFSASNTAMCNTAADSASFTYIGGNTGTSTYYLVGFAGAITTFDPVDNPNIAFGPNQVRNVFVDATTTCTNRDTITIQVDSFPNVTVSSIPGTYCYNAGAFGYSGTPVSPGSTPPNVASYFTAPSLGISDFKNVAGQNSGTYNPSSTDIGQHWLYYNYTSPVTGCFAKDSVQIDILDIPVLELRRLSNPLSPLVHCLGDTVHYEKLINGSKDMNPLAVIVGSGFADSTSNVFDPDLATVGSHLVTYKSSDVNGCYNETDTNIVVLPTADASFSLSDSIECIDPNTTISVSPVNNSGTFYFHGTSKVNSSGETFYLDSTTVGLNSVRYIYDDGSGCADTVDKFVTVNDTPSVSISQIDPQYCYNQGIITLKASQASLGSSYFRSYFYPGAQVFNGLIDSALLANTNDSVQFTPSSAYADSVVYVDYVHVDVNGCVGIGRDNFLIKDIPVLDITFSDVIPGNPNPNDNNVCANYETINLLGQAVANSSTNFNGGYFTGSVFGQLNNLVSTDTASNGIYGTFPNDQFYTDTITYHFQDPALFGCYNEKDTIINIKRLPPPAFTVDATSLPNSNQICPNEKAFTTTFYDSQSSGFQAQWNLTRRWYINDSARTAFVAGQFNPGGVGLKDSTNYTAWNFITHEMFDNDFGCYNRHTDSVFLDSFPIVSIFIDSLYCSNQGTVTFKASPASPGTAVPNIPASIFTSSNIDVSPFTNDTTVLSSSGLDSILVDVNTIIPPGVAQTKNIFLNYYHTNPTTGCATLKKDTFKLKRAPVLDIQIAKNTYCPYDNVDSVRFIVNNLPAGGSGLDSVTGQGLTGNISSTGRMAYNPKLFFGDTTTHNELITYVHIDDDGCTNTSIDSSIKVKHQPILSLSLTSTSPPAVPLDSVCFETAPFPLTIMYWHIDSAKFTPYGPLTGNASPGDDNWFRYNNAPSDNGSQSKIFDPSEDANGPSGDTAGVVTVVDFIGTYAQSGGCYDTVTSQIIIHPEPIADFYLDGLCGKYMPVMHGDSSFMDTVNFSPSDGISQYQWTVGGDDKAWNIAPLDTFVDFQYDSALQNSLVNIDLRVLSKKGCRSAKVTKTFQFLTSPNSNFSWYFSDECLGDTITFRSDTTLIPNLINTTYFWDFGDGNTSTNQVEASHVFAAADTFAVSLALSEGTSSCRDTFVNNVFIRPTLDSTSYPYLDDFESAYSGWVIWKEAGELIYQDTSLPGQPTLDTAVYFEKGMPSKKFINSTASGSNAFVTGLNKNPAENLQTSVTSPCFDMRGLDRPMVKLQTLYQIQSNDGAVLQYTTDKDKRLEDVIWENVAEYQSSNNNFMKRGINWYNAENIFGEPGSQTNAQGKIGWTDSSGLPNQWLEARHNLDMILDSTYVRFRVAYGSDPSLSLEGFAFDDFEITERKRKVLFEGFVNSSVGGDAGTIDIFNTLVNNGASDVIDVQYHAAFPAADPMNQQNTADPSSRSLYYNVGEVPYVHVNGTNFKGFMNSTNFGDFVYKPIALTDPLFKIAMAYNENTSQVDVTVTAVGPAASYPLNIAVHVAMVEREILASEFTTVNANYTKFNSVLKKMYPTASGTSFTVGFEGWSDNLTQTVNFDNFFTDSLYRIVAFVQDKNTKAVYQAEMLQKGKLGTDVFEYEDLVADGVEYNLFPNPTSNKAFMEFKNELLNSYELRVFNQLGAQVMMDRIPEGTRMHQLDMQDLDAGMYFIMLNDGEHKVAIKKLMVTH
ncbi:MAG: T9SS type A sorting domain-containing protein [Vicingaceae bacterium]